MKKEDASQATSDTSKQLKTINKNCDIYQRLSKQASGFRASLPNDDMVFNQTIVMYLMILSSKPIFNTTCKNILSSAAKFINGESSEVSRTIT